MYIYTVGLIVKRTLTVSHTHTVWTWLSDLIVCVVCCLDDGHVGRCFAVQICLSLKSFHMFSCFLKWGRKKKGEIATGLIYLKQININYNSIDYFFFFKENFKELEIMARE